ncbi:MAG: tetratricopeptide repeat protein [Oligoflexia bacterium]|nr:tetratricopeptide repeat protein [Oligoflexia bacterium]
MRVISWLLSVIILIFIMYSCSSGSTINDGKSKKYYGDSNTDEGDTETAGAGAEFKSIPKKVIIPNAVEYDYLKDNYEFTNNNNKGATTTILDRETLNKHSANVLEDLINDNGTTSKNNSANDPFIKAFSFCYLKKFNESKDEIKKLYWEYKNFPTYWNLVGSCYLLEGNIPKARLYYNKALEIDQNYTPVLNNLGVLYLKEKREQKALAAFLKASKSSSFAITPIYNLANLYLKYGLVEKALPLYQTLYSNYTSSNNTNSNNSDENSNDKIFPELALNYSYALILSGQEIRSKDVFNSIDFSRVKENPKLEKKYYEIRNFISN